MIHEIGVELDEKLKAKGCPIGVIDGPDFETTTWGNERIVIETSGGDTFEGPRSQSVNAKVRGIRNIGVKISIYARMPKGGGQPFEHRRRCDHVLDLVFCALEEVVRARKNGLTIKGGDYFTPPDLADSETENGCAYALLVTIERGIADLTWAYEKRPEKTIEAVTTTTTFNGTTVEPPPP